MNIGKIRMGYYRENCIVDSATRSGYTRQWQVVEAQELIEYLRQEEAVGGWKECRGQRVFKYSLGNIDLGLGILLGVADVFREGDSSWS